jgi:hypothetical protein
MAFNWTAREDHSRADDISEKSASLADSDGSTDVSDFRLLDKQRLSPQGQGKHICRCHETHPMAAAFAAIGPLRKDVSMVGHDLSCLRHKGDTLRGQFDDARRIDATYPPSFQLQQHEFARRVPIGPIDPCRNRNRPGGAEQPLCIDDPGSSQFRWRRHHHRPARVPTSAMLSTSNFIVLLPSFRPPCDTPMKEPKRTARRSPQPPMHNRRNPGGSGGMSSSGRIEVAAVVEPKVGPQSALDRLLLQHSSAPAIAIFEYHQALANAHLS